MSIDKLVEMSNRYGRDSKYVLAGGGNTSVKENGTLYVKGSGTRLATISKEGFVALSIEKLMAMLDKNYSGETGEAESSADMLRARLDGEGHKRPSVEALLHAIIPYKFVLHLHPTLINGVTCAHDGEAAVTDALGDKAVWIGLCKPGVPLAKMCNRALNDFYVVNHKNAQLIFLQNHGIFYAADTVEEIDELTAMVNESFKPARTADLSPADFDRQAAVNAAVALKAAYKNGGSACCVFLNTAETKKLTEYEQAFEPVRKAFTPDHIVYCKAKCLFIKKDEDVYSAYQNFTALKGFSPKIVGVEGVGAFALGESKKDADTAGELFLDAASIAAISESFGGFEPLTQELADYITNWEAEAYRSKIAMGGKAEKRLSERVAVVTGSAQGFGRGIAESLAKEGAYIVVADLNFDGAKQFADELNAQYGAGKAIAVSVNVSDDASVSALVEETALNYGGLDLFVSNAGVLKAGGLDEIDKKTFEFVTSINYTGYFLCAKFASALMKKQHELMPERFFDIIEINSKSGLVGSNKNFAYAGGKFGGVGLTQSFALELIPYNIKVNAICPGNFYDGPLWSDPERGLFVQYLRAGKVPGAKTIQDVKDFYLSKSPIKRGCTPADVAKAIFYAVEQDYETGQAIPVTGGQVMLS